MLHTYQFWKQKQVMCLLCVYAVCHQHSVQACFVKKDTHQHKGPETILKMLLQSMCMEQMVLF